MDVEGFLQWARARPGAPSSLETWREHAVAIVSEAGAGAVWQKHVDEVLRRAEERRDEVGTLALIRRVGDALIEYQRTLPDANAPVIPADAEPIPTGRALRQIAANTLRNPIFWRVTAGVIFVAIVAIIGFGSTTHRDQVLNHHRTRIIERQCARLGLDVGSPEMDNCVRNVSRACAGAGASVSQVGRCAAAFVERGFGP